jgi:hypothetical protein
MKKPIAFNNSTVTQYGTKLGGNLEIGDKQVDYGAGSAASALDWFNSLDPVNQYVIVSDTASILDVSGNTYTIDDNAAGRPIMWCTGDKTDINVLNTINRLPGRRGEVPFTGATEAINWVNGANDYYLLTFNEFLKTYAGIVRVDLSDNYHVAVLNYETNAASVTDLNISSNDWNHYDIVPVQGKGYMSLFRFGSNNDSHRILFMTHDGTIVTDYTNPDDSTDWDFNPLDRNWSYYIDRTNGMVKYFDGLNAPHTFTFDPINEQFSIPWDWDGTTSNGEFVFRVRNTDTISDEFYLVASDGSANLIKTVNYGDYTVRYNTAVGSNFIVELEYSENDNKYTAFTILDSTGTIIDGTDLTTLTGGTYNDYDFQFFGSNKCCIIFRNTSDNNVPYFIAKYDETISNYYTTTHARGSEFVNFDLIGNANYRPRNYKQEMAAIVFHSNDYDQTDGNFYFHTYLDIMQFAEGYSTPNLINFVENQTLGTYDYGIRLYDWEIGGGLFVETKVLGEYGILTLKDNNTTANLVLDTTAANVDSSWRNAVGEKLYVAPFLWSDQNNNTLLSVPIYWISKDGTLLDQHTMTGDTQSVSLNSTYSYGTLYLGNYTAPDPSVGGVYINDNDTFTVTKYYNNTYNQDDTYLTYDDFKTGGGILLIDNTNKLMKTINKTGASTEFAFPVDYGDVNFNISDDGPNYFMFSYEKNDSTIGAIVYDYSGNTIQTLATTTDTVRNNYGVVDNRVYIETNSGVNYTLTMLTPTGQESVQYSVHVDSTPNDVEWFWC